ncbi:fatty-acid amide hydrolase 2-like [Galleria mellonella]|uniref:Fatty-acid amide hydrolase 2-like n=1 Tax=Galleria mellonella TaxID=7137 RepID=A0ABM3MI59_GALME|nr:fatty-acid amide hydrolase 2-like [Galleria mellonella]
MCKVLRAIFSYVRLFIDYVIDFFFSLYWEGKKKPIPDLQKKYAYLADSACTLARKIKNKELKSEELVRAVIERIKEVNPVLNAVVCNRYEEALAEAREVDRLIAGGLSPKVEEEKPFLGVPFTTKESQAVKGMNLTMGLWARRNERADEDSEAVVLLKKAGAIPLACTNLPELLIWPETRNPVYGTTNNPHHTGRSPGGSSGAEAALMATYATPISLCSDIGGSIRIPAFFCGMFGHHPTADTTNLRGVFYRKGDEGPSMFALGFITKHVEDLAPLTKVVAGDKAGLLNLDRKVDIKNLKYYYMETSYDCQVSPIRSELKAVMQRVVSKIRRDVTTAANPPQPYHHEGFNYMYRLWLYWMNKEPHNYSSMYNNGKSEPNAIVELIKKMLFMSRHCFFTIMQLLESQVLPSIKADWAEKLTKDLKDDLFSKLGNDSVLLLPCSPYATPYHYTFYLRPYNSAYFSIVNVLKSPATQVPIGVNKKGLPLGIQVVAAPHNDALCLAVAKYLEREFGGAVMACRIRQ